VLTVGGSKGGVSTVTGWSGAFPLPATPGAGAEPEFSVRGGQL
jgi:hypothetical protein